MSLFDTEELTVCPLCNGAGTVFDGRLGEDRQCRCQFRGWRVD